MDDLPTQRGVNQKIYIINSSYRADPGDHWVLVYFHGGKAEFFDPAGRDITFYDAKLSQFVRLYALRQNAPQQVQSTEGATCGHVCLYYALQRCRGETMNSILRHFHPTLYTLNDEVARHYVRLHFYV